ncbi:histidine kinase [Microbacterium sp. STN6]|uniref:sensor histidine kinase n=1 Tax=Microbacterium sp. STN6 TaxID=2995588 RepID=UPI00226082F5|nr:histidine kinase [Microbacterium sp. STN6]MCX7522299.1 histidine kinase [Microbacterium sp. STN6]
MRGWRWGWRNLLYDVAPPVVLLALGLIDVFTESLAIVVGSAPAVTAILPGAIACLALLIRRYRPLTTVVIILLAVLLPPLVLPTSLTYWDEFMTLVIAVYSCGRHLRRGWAFVGLGVAAVGMAILPFEFADMRNAGDILYNSLMLAVAFGIGLLARSWTGYRERSLREAAERAVAEERASQAERARIARELHDVIAHTITVIVMQAGGARLASATDPAIAASTLAQIEELGRASLAELRTLLPLLRADGEATSMPPQPTLADVTALCERMRGLGLAVELVTDGDTSALPLGLQLTAYRVVQEGLTNAMKHAPSAETGVRIRHILEPALLTVDVSSTGPAAPSPLPGAGRGLAGIRERVLLAGGTFGAGAHAAGFLLHVELPLERELA